MSDILMILKDDLKNIIEEKAYFQKDINLGNSFTKKILTMKQTLSGKKNI